MQKLVYITDIRQQVLAAVEARIRSGELTVRKLAQRAGMSQPALANAIARRRTLSVEYTDQLVLALELDLHKMATALRDAA